MCICLACIIIEINKQVTICMYLSIKKLTEADYQRQRELIAGLGATELPDGDPRDDDRVAHGALRAAQDLLLLVTGQGHRMDTQPPSPAHVQVAVGRVRLARELREACAGYSEPSIRSG